MIWGKSCILEGSTRAFDIVVVSEQRFDVECDGAEEPANDTDENLQYPESDEKAVAPIRGAHVEVVQ